MQKQHYFLILAALFLCAASTLSAQTVVFEDNFDSSFDFVAAGGVGTTGWDGIEMPQGIVVDSNITSPGMLTIQVDAAAAATDFTPDVILYKNMTSDFIATLKLQEADETYNYSGAFVMARAPFSPTDEAGTGEDWVGNKWFPGTWAGQHGNNVNDGARAEDRLDGSNLYPYMQLERRGDLFILRYSSDGSIWTDGVTYTRSDLAGASVLQIGLVFEAVDGGSGVDPTAQFDWFRLEEPPAGKFVLVEPRVDTLAFHEVEVGETSPYQPVRYRNDGATTLTITDVVVEGDYVTNPNPLNLPREVAINGEGLFSIAAKPTAAGPQTGTLKIVSDNSVEISTYTLNLRTNPAPIYVSSSLGDDATGDGSEANPYATVQKGVDVSLVGDQIYLLPGDYGDFSLAGAERVLRISAPDGGATFVGSKVDLTAAAGVPILLEIEGVDFVPVQDATGGESLIHVAGPGTKVLTVEQCSLQSDSTLTTPPFALIGTSATNGGRFELTVANSTLDGDGVSDAVNIQAANSAPLSVTNCAIANVLNGVVQSANGGLFVQDCTFEAATGRMVTTTGHTQSGGAWWGAVEGDAVVDRCHFADGGGKYLDAGANGDYVVWLFSIGNKTVSNSVIEGCGYGVRSGWIWDVSPFSLINSTLVSDDVLTTGSGMFADGGVDQRIQNCAVLGFQTPLDTPNADSVESNNLTDVATDGDPNFAFQSGGAFALPSTTVGPAGFIPVSASPLLDGGTDTGLAADYYGSSRPKGAAYDIGAFEGGLSAPVFESESLQHQWVRLSETLTGPTPILAAGYPDPTFTLDSASEGLGMTINPETGVVTWDSVGPEGQYEIVITATNGAGSDTTFFVLDVFTGASPVEAGSSGWVVYE